MNGVLWFVFFFSSRRRHTRCALVTGVQTCALPIWTFRHDREALVQAVTERGAGYWVLTPLETPRFTLLVNRGFVPKDRRNAMTRAAGHVAAPVTVTGLLRVTEPGGAFLRDRKSTRLNSSH